METPPRAATTEGRRPTAQLSVRSRLTAGILLLTLVAMSLAGLLVYTLESAQIEREVNAQINQEVEEFRTLEREGIDPATALPFTSPESLLSTFLTRNVPDDDEMLVAYVRGQDPFITSNRYGADFLDSPAYRAAVADIGDEVSTVVVEDPDYGQVWVSSVPVRNTTQAGALVIVSFLDDEHRELNSTMQTYAIVSAILLLGVAGIAAWQSGRLLAPLRTLGRTAEEITASDLSQRIPERGNDDITALTRTFNEMLDRVAAGYEAQRRFLDDAGHELRTPLTVLGGHLELLDPTQPDEVAATRDLLSEEVDRMSRLVGDLILLAKTRRPDFLNPRATDLDSFTQSVLAKARALGDRDWQLDSTGVGTASVDDQRLTQAVLQLADNAVKHTSPGDRIAIGSAVDVHAEGSVVAQVWVADSGRGVPPADRERIFERFGRSRVTAGDEGFGLGLSIVRAIAEAHGGTVTVIDERPHGARFTITIPWEDHTWPTS